MASPFISIDLTGDKALIKNLNTLGDRVHKKVVRKATATAMVPMAQEVRRRARAIADTGTLAKSIGRITKMSRGKIVTRVGPREGFKNPKSGEDAARYIWILEFGSEHFAPRSIMRAAFDRTIQKVLARFERLLRIGIEKEARMKR